MSELINHIGLIIWGSKDGVQDFIRSDNMKLDDPEILIAIKRDIRSVFRMSSPGIIFYSLEFTSQYRVYTCYKTIRDYHLRTHSFLAISIYMPYAFTFEKGVLGLLKRLMELYSANYLNSDLVIIETEEDKYEFFNVINNHQAEDHTLKVSICDISKRKKVACVDYANETILSE